MSKELAELLFPNVCLTKGDLQNKYPVRDKNTVVTRFAPSPTGFLHIGGVYTSLIDRKMAHQRNGIFMLRIEDTDKKREVAGSKEIILNVFDKLGMSIDEGVVSPTEEKGQYGPYVQSKREEIYHVLAKELVEKGFAYPCFCTESELEEIRQLQSENKAMPGYYREYAKYRDASVDTIKKLLAEGKSYVLRFRVPDDIPGRVGINDLIKGEIDMENNYNDFVLLKNDGIPTYHFAHACDDYLMGTTEVIRGDEWIASLPIHIQLFEALGFNLPKYAHVAPVMKQDGDSRRKLSKRKDPESSAEYYLEQGYPVKALFVYLYTLINSNFEEWYLENKEKDIDEFEFKYENMGVSGPLYDLDKLNNISSEIIYETPIEENVKNLKQWAQEFSLETYERIIANEELVYQFFKTQGPESNEHRKDLSHYSMFMQVFGIFYADIFDQMNEDYKVLLEENIPTVEQNEIIQAFIQYFEEVKNGSEKTLKELSKELNYTDKKKFAKNPEQYRGIMTSFYHGLRILLTHKDSGISMDDVVAVLGYDEVIRRLKKAL